MYLKYLLFISIDVFIFIEKSKSDFTKNCSYEYTVDLTKSIHLQNNYYLYDKDTLITPDLVHEFNFRIFNNGTRIDVKPYKRGCICAIKNCIRFCSNQAIELYENGLSSDLDKIFTKNVTLSNKQSVEKHLIHDFYPIFGTVCEFSEQVPVNNWTLFENGILRHNLDERNFTQNEYCFDSIGAFENNTLLFLNPVVCNKADPWIQIYGFAFSIPFFIVIIVLFILFSNLRNVRGKCFVTYLTFLTLAYTLFSFHKISGLPETTRSCKIYSYVLYYILIAVYIWFCILCFETWTTLTQMVKEQQSYRKYSKIGFTIPLIMTVIRFVTDCQIELKKHSNCIFLNENPLYVFLFFDLLAILIVICSITLYVLILRYSWKTRKDQLNYFSEIQKDQFDKIMTYSRLFFFMGFEFSFVFVSRVLRKLYADNDRIVLISIYMGYSAKILQGPLMFLVFICSPRVRSEIKKKFTRNSPEVRIKLSRSKSSIDELK